MQNQQVVEDLLHLSAGICPIHAHMHCLCACAQLAVFVEGASRGCAGVTAYGVALAGFRLHCMCAVNSLSAS